MKKIAFLLLLITTYYYLFTAQTVLAQTETPIDSPSATKEELKERLKEVVQEKMKSTEENLENEAKLNRLSGFAGTITDIAQNAISLESRKINLQVSIATETAIIKEGKTIKKELLSINDKIIAIGYLNPPDVLSAKRIVVIKNDPAQYTKKIIFSSVLKVDLRNKTLTLDNLTVTLSKKLKLDITSLSPGQKIFGVVQQPADPKQTPTLLLANII